MNIQSGFTVTSQSGLFRPAYGETYGFPTHDLQAAQEDAQHMANVLNQPVNLLSNQTHQVLYRFVPMGAGA